MIHHSSFIIHHSIRQSYCPLIFLLLLLTACRQPPPVPSAVSSPIVVVASPTPPPTSTPVAATVQPSPPATEILQPPPGLVWVRTGDTGYPILISDAEKGEFSYERAPRPLTAFWDYSPLTGRLAYGILGSQADLLVYDYKTGKNELWLESNVRQALWSPVIDPKTGLQPLAVALSDKTLALMTGPNQMTTLSKNFSPFFSWSPDGRWLAFTDVGAVFVTSVETGETRQLNAKEEEEYGRGGTPAWVLERGVLFYAYKAFVKVVKLDGSEAFIPVPAGAPQPERSGVVIKILWSEQHSLLITAFSGTGPYEVDIYQLSDDLRTIIKSYALVGVSLGDWWVPGESILLDGGPIWSLTKEAPLAPPARIVSSLLSPDGEWRAEVIDYPGCFRGWKVPSQYYQELRFVQVKSGVEQSVDRQFRYCEMGSEPHFSDLYWSPNSRYFYYTRNEEIRQEYCRLEHRPIRRLAVPPGGSDMEARSWEMTLLGSGLRSPDGTKLATWQYRPARDEPFKDSGYDLVIWELDGGELGRPTPLLGYPERGAIAWSPDSQSLVYTQTEGTCLVDGKGYIIQLDLPGLEQSLVLMAQNQSFDNLIWERPDELRLFAGAVEWRYNFNSQELKSVP